MAKAFLASLKSEKNSGLRPLFFYYITSTNLVYTTSL